MNWIQSLRTWRRDRNIIKPQGTYVPMIQEELQEYLDAQTVEERIDAIGDIIVLSVNEMELEGYNVDLVMKQILKEISSRVQDPDQLKDWLENGPSGKWQKYRAQPIGTLYTADFSCCKTKQS